MKKYKRLTERVGKGICVKETSTSDNRSIWNAINRLAELEDKIENGTLIELPCKVGDTVYFVCETDNDELFIDKGLIEGFSYDEAGVLFKATYKNLTSSWHTILSFGDGVFLTKVEAEKALAEIIMEEKRGKGCK